MCKTLQNRLGDDYYNNEKSRICINDEQWCRKVFGSKGIDTKELLDKMSEFFRTYQNEL